MPNIKSAKKRVKVIDKKTAHNRVIKSDLKTRVKAFQSAVENGENADELFKTAVKKVDMAAQKGIIHKNKANRMKSRLAKKIG